MGPCKIISHIEGLDANFFSNPTHQTETGSLQVGGSLETTNSNPLGPIKLSTQLETGNSQYIPISPCLFDRSRALQAVHLFRIPAKFQ
jgi:hypothetical protein